MRNNSDYKAEALAALKGKWAPSVLAVIVYVFGILIFFVPYWIKALRMDPTDLSAVKGLSSWFLFYLAGVFLVGGPLLVGMVNAFKVLLLQGDDRLVSNEIRIGFGNWLHHAWAYFLRGLYVLLWTILFIIPGIVKTLAYAMTNYILVDHPELSANKAILLSNEMMKGHKYDLFYLYLSFAGWFILCLITLGIGFFWLIPYAQTAQASFYQDVKAEWEARHSMS
jgi:uncharacterized membrane protein